MGKDIKIAVTVGILVTLIVLVLWLVKDNAKAVDDLKGFVGRSPLQAARRDSGTEPAPVVAERPAARQAAPDAEVAPAGRSQRPTGPVYVPEPARQTVRSAGNGATKTPDGERLVARIGRTERPEPATTLPDVGRSNRRFDGVGAQDTERETTPEREAPAAREEAAREVQPAAKTYTVVPNDSLSTISRKVYGSTKHWKKIQAANSRRFPNGSTLVGIGWKLKIPPLDTSSVAAAIVPPAPPAEAITTVAAARVHVVQKGQTLYQIARKYYRDGKQWRVVYDANKARIPDPNHLPVGVSLKIPQEG